MKKTILLLIALFFLTGCATVEYPSKPDRRPSVKRHAQFRKKRLKLIENSARVSVKLRPKNAKVQIVRHGSKEGTMQIGIHVVDYGTAKPPVGKKTLPSSQVGVSLKKPGYVGQVLEIYSPAKDTTATLIPFSTAPNRIETSFARASQAYNLPAAYPTYMPNGYRLAKAEYQDIIQGDFSPGLNPTTRFLFLEWSKGQSVVLMQIFSAEGIVALGRPPEYGKTVWINDNLKARFVRGTNLVNFFLNNKLVWYLSADDGMPRSVMIKIVKSMRSSK